LALVQAIQVVAGGSSAVKIKWPNDIYAKITQEKDGEVEEDGIIAGGGGAAANDGGSQDLTNDENAPSTLEASSFIEPPVHDQQYTKIGGVLCQSTYDYSTKTFVVVAGIGLNVENQSPTTCLKSLYPSHVIVNRENVLATFFNRLEPMLESFNDTGFQHFYNDYVNEWLVSDCDSSLFFSFALFVNLASISSCFFSFFSCPFLFVIMLPAHESKT
jgi:biotin-(acetyl-CoA carboxylase) ligase